MYSTLLLDISGAVATITLNRPDKRNAISATMMAELQTALDDIEKSHARVAILTGAGTAFCSGMDLEMLAAIAGQSPAENQEDSRRMAKMSPGAGAFPGRASAAVKAAPLAGAWGFATWCNFTLAVPGGRLGYSEVKIEFLRTLVSFFLIRKIGEKPTGGLLL